MIRHSVLFSFKHGTDKADLDRIEDKFLSLQSAIPEIVDIEWGLNNSPEGKTKGFTHMFFLTFKNIFDRDSYLINPRHQEFSGMVGPFLEDVLVFDYEI